MARKTRLSGSRGGISQPRPPMKEEERKEALQVATNRIGRTDGKAEKHRSVVRGSAVRGEGGCLQPRRGGARTAARATNEDCGGGAAASELPASGRAETRHTTTD